MINANHNPSGLLGAVITKWMAIPLDEEGQAIAIPNHSDKTVQIYGTFGGASVVIQASNDPLAPTDPDNAVWWTVKNVEAELMNKSAAGGWLLMDNPIWMRPIVTGGDGTTSLNVVMCSKRG